MLLPPATSCSEKMANFYLPNATSWMPMVLGDGECVSMSQSDMASAFYLFAIPEQWYPWILKLLQNGHVTPLVFHASVYLGYWRIHFDNEKQRWTIELAAGFQESPKVGNCGWNPKVKFQQFRFPAVWISFPEFGVCLKRISCRGSCGGMFVRLEPWLWLWARTPGACFQRRVFLRDHGAFGTPNIGHVNPEFENPTWLVFTQLRFVPFILRWKIFYNL